jgi:hypothetical protein
MKVMVQVRRRRNEDVAYAAQDLLAAYAAANAPVSAPPVPFELIAEWLDLGIERVDLSSISSDALGGISFRRRLIYVTPATFIGVRYGFTVCHELGHWRLHRPSDDAAAPSGPLGEGTRPEGIRIESDIICRDGDRSPIEREADLFAANLLMPEDLLVPLARTKDLSYPGTIDRLAARFRASAQAMERRLRELALL